jgi:hypothetical protein
VWSRGTIAGFASDEEMGGEGESAWILVLAVSRGYTALAIS